MVTVAAPFCLHRRFKKVVLEWEKKRHRLCDVLNAPFRMNTGILFYFVIRLRFNSIIYIHIYMYMLIYKNVIIITSLSLWSRRCLRWNTWPINSIQQVGFCLTIQIGEQNIMFGVHQTNLLQGPNARWRRRLYPTKAAASSSPLRADCCRIWHSDVMSHILYI